MRHTLDKKVIISLLLITSIIFTSSGEAVTTLGQEEDAFAKIWSHKDKDLPSMKLDSMKHAKGELKKNENISKTEKCSSRKCLTETLKLLQNRDIIGARLY
ncbi:MAG: hypothetical protein BGO77_00285 [Caedibacter sp. 37-49]|nr:MAG: hypothetical protein BGO77_00285 [Caedibacter sp. 37-49]